MNKNRLKAWIAYDGTGRVIPGSLRWSTVKPKNGNWQEFTTPDLCCTTTTTTTSLDIQ